MYTQKICYAGYEISKSFFPNIKLDGNKTKSIFVPDSSIKKLSKRNDYVSLTFIKSKLK